MKNEREKALELHRKYGSNQQIVKHCETVASVAKMLVDALRLSGEPIDEEAVIIAASLHDIGRTRTQSVHHGYVGAEILGSEGLDGPVAEIVRRHIGAGISKEEASSLGFPDGDYVPRTLEEKIVCFADKMVDGVRVRPFAEEVKRFTAKGHDVERLKALKESLKEAMRQDPEEIVFSKLRA